MESDFFLGLKGPRLIKSVIKHTEIRVRVIVFQGLKLAYT